MGVRGFGERDAAEVVWEARGEICVQERDVADVVCGRVAISAFGVHSTRRIVVVCVGGVGKERLG